MSGWLQKRKTSPALSTEVKDAVDILPSASNKEKASDADDRPLYDIHAKPAQTGPEVRRDITNHDVSAMCKALFPDEPVLPVQ